MLLERKPDNERGTNHRVGVVILSIVTALCLAGCVAPIPSSDQSIPTTLSEKSTPAPAPTASPSATSAPAVPSTPVPCSEGALREALIAGGTLHLAPGCEVLLTADLPLIVSDTVISGNGAVIDGGGMYRILRSDSADITVEQLAIRNGYSDSEGAGVSTGDGRIVIESCVLSGNVSQTSGGAVGSAGGDVVIRHSELVGNEADFGGGAVVISGGHVTVTHSVFSGNTSTGCGAGILAHAGRVEIEYSAFFDNQVVVHGGGGLCLASAEAVAVVTNSTLSGNVSARGGGAIAAAGGSELTLVASTLSHNTATRGGGIWTEGPLTLQQSIVAGNRASTGIDVEVERIAAADFQSLGYNLVGQVGGLALAPSDIVETAFDVGPLVDGIHTLDVGNPAWDAIPAEACVTRVDQRGIERPQGAGCDIGAIEMPDGP